GEAHAMAIAEPKPADASWQSLEFDALPRHVEPLVKVLVVGQQLFDLFVSLVDVLGIARQRDPSEGSDAAAEQRADIGGDEARECEGFFEPFLLRHLADVVA